MNKVPIGYKAICEQLKLDTLPHYRTSYIALQGRGKTIIDQHHEIHIYPKTYALANPTDLLAQLEFALKYDGMNLEIISAMFQTISPSAVTTYIKEQPTGIYARRIWYLYEFLMSIHLDIPDSQRIKYIDLLDAKTYFTASPIKSPRHAINDNLLGNRLFCPLVRRTEQIEKYIALKLDEKAQALVAKYDPSLIARAFNYLYNKETMSSYQIEKEQPDKNRAQRFIHLLQQAANIDMLSKEKLIELQNIIVDPRFKNLDYRENQNYVGETLSSYFQKIHYISPKPNDLADLMQGLLASLERMFNADIHPVIIAAAISFGFVFIHPFEDGNGRIHRFLVHYILSKKNFTPKDMVFPISAIMLKNMRDYDVVLESFSKPLLSLINDYQLEDDGKLMVNQETKSFYQYIDLTQVTEYLFICIEAAIDKHIESEIEFLMHYDETKQAIQELVDMPDNQIDLLIKCIVQNKGTLSQQKRQRFFALLTDEEIKQLEYIINVTMINGNRQK